MKSLGKHLICDFFDCDRDILNDINKLKEYLEQAVSISGAVIVSSEFHAFSPYGITGIIMIAEFHFSIHTWPEYGFAALDIFTCGEDINGKTALKYLEIRLQAQKIKVEEIFRGELDLPPEKIFHKPQTSEL